MSATRRVPGTLVRQIIDDGARECLAHNIIEHASNDAKEPALSRVFEYRRNVDPDLDKKATRRWRKEFAPT
jgi:catalase